MNTRAWLLIAVLALSWAGTGWAADTPAQAEAPGADTGRSGGLDLAQERERIDTLRRAELARQKSVEAECYRLFSVNDCLQKGRGTHRQIMADLKRQEVRLNDRERRDKASAQMKRIEDKVSSSERDDDLARRQEAATRSGQEQAAGTERKAAQQQSARQEREGRVQDQAQRSAQQRQEAQDRAAKAAAAPSERAQFEAKQKEAAQRRQARQEKLQADRPAIAPLPAPAPAPTTP